MLIRLESIEDQESIRAVHRAAFSTDQEAELVDALRDQASPIVSYVAETENVVVGHILFTPVTLAEHPELRICGLAPMAVIPEKQRTGIGSALVGAGLDSARDFGFQAVVVLGHPDYYPRFGFAPASQFGLRCEYDVPDDVFMALEMEKGACAGVAGVVKYHPVFGKT